MTVAAAASEVRSLLKLLSLLVSVDSMNRSESEPESEKELGLQTPPSKKP